jgi:hypothetical protein
MNRNIQIKEELEELAPMLAKLKNREAPSMQAAYFTAMQDKVMATLNSKEDAPAPIYFETMQNQVMKSVTEKRATKTIKFFPIIKWAAAASIAIVMLWFPYNYYTQTTPNTYASELNIDIDNQQEVDYLIDYLNTDADFDYLQSITSEESIPSSDAPESEDYLFTDEELELLIDM